MPLRTASVLFCSVLFCDGVIGQGQWAAPFNHPNSGPLVAPASASLPGATPQYWITENTVNASGQPINVPGSRFQSIHTCLIPVGPYRGCLLMWDGNLTLVGTRAYQPWAIVNPYGPGGNPFVAGGGSLFTFHNAVLQMPAGLGELFCAGQRWTADGRLLVAGGTRVYPPSNANPNLPLVNTGVAGAWEGAVFVYQWDAALTTGNPFGTWRQMPNMEAERWYPTVTPDGSTQDRFLILGGTDILPGTGFGPVNTYESYRINFGQVIPAILAVEQKPGSPPPPPTARQYAGTTISTPIGPLPVFTEYPRAHPIGILDPISIGTAPRMLVSGYFGQALRWAHDKDTNPGYAFNIGQETVQSYIVYSTNLLLPAGVGAMPSKVLRIGGLRTTTAGGGPTDRVESVVATIPSTQSNFWSTGGPGDLPDMLRKRHFGNVVILPTGDLFAIGGVDGTGPVAEPEMFRANNGDWKVQAPQFSPRDYHSCAVLLPDGRVFVGGGELRTADYEIFTPDYLLGPSNRRPVGANVLNATTGLPISQTNLQAVTYGQQCIATWTNALPAGVEVAQVVLMAPAALTHHDDGGQRLVRLATLYPDDAIGAGSLHFLLPPSYLHAPPGWYMLFLVTNEGVPANAFWINLR